MANLERIIVAQSEGWESVGSWHKENWVNVEPRRAQAQTLSRSSIRASPTHFVQRSQGHSVSSSPAPRDLEMDELRVQVCQLRRYLRQRVNMREHRSPTRSPNFSSGEERSHRRRTRSLQKDIHREPSFSIRREKHLYRRNRTPRGIWGAIPWVKLCARYLIHRSPTILKM